jgi:ABC-type multidrug transport system fused ATPase/permease subunit
MSSRLKTAYKLMAQGFGQYKPQILLLIGLGFVSAFLEAVGINAIIPLFSFVSGNQGSETDMISRAIEGFFQALNISFTLKYLLIFMVSLFILKALAKLLFNYIQIKITSNYEQDVRDKLFSSTLRANWPYLMQQKIGYLETVLLNDAAHSAYLLRYLAQIILLFTSLIIYTLAALSISTTITLSTFALGIIILFLLRRFVYRTRVTSQKFADLTKEVSHHINENMIGIKTVKAMGTQESVIKKGREHFLNLKNLRIKNFLLQSIPNEMIEPIGLIFIVGLFAYMYKFSSIEFSFAAFAVIVYLINRIFGYLKNAQMKAHSINEFIPYLKSTVEYNNQALKNKEEDTGEAKFSFNQQLEFKDVGFTYNENNKKVLKKINFTIKKGAMIGLIGPSGAGKTTVVDLILRLFEPKTGNICLDGQDITHIDLSAWRKKLGYVSQDIFLINDTIENNIRFYDKSITRKDIQEASKMANISKFVEDLPQGYKTIVGEQGVKLSGGQRQRIILARVLARQPELLILDEATSALDNQSEVAVQKAIDNLKGKVTVLVIAHRLSTVMNTDKLIVLEKGSIVEQDTPQQLLKDKDSYFYKVYNIREK